MLSSLLAPTSPRALPSSSKPTRAAFGSRKPFSNLHAVSSNSGNLALGNQSLRQMLPTNAYRLYSSHPFPAKAVPNPNTGVFWAFSGPVRANLRSGPVSTMPQLANVSAHASLAWNSIPSSNKSEPSSPPSLTQSSRPRVKLASADHSAPPRMISSPSKPNSPPSAKPALTSTPLTSATNKLTLPSPGLKKSTL